MSGVPVVPWMPVVTGTPPPGSLVPAATHSPQRDLTATSPALSTALGNVIREGIAANTLDAVRANLHHTQGSTVLDTYV